MNNVINFSWTKRSQLSCRPYSDSFNCVNQMCRGKAFGCEVLKVIHGLEQPLHLQFLLAQFDYSFKNSDRSVILLQVFQFQVGFQFESSLHSGFVFWRVGAERKSHCLFSVHGIRKFEVCSVHGDADLDPLGQLLSVKSSQLSPHFKNMLIVLVHYYYYCVFVSVCEGQRTTC